MVEIWYGGKLIGYMDKYDSRRWTGPILTNDEEMALQGYYRNKLGIDDMLDFVVPDLKNRVSS